MKKPTSKGPEVRAAQEAHEEAKKAPVVSLPPTGVPGESHAWQSGLLFFGIIAALTVALVGGGLEFWSRVHGG
jgi:hypothetical protein